MGKIELRLCLVFLVFLVGSVAAQRPAMFCKQDSYGQLYDCHYAQPETSTVVVRENDNPRPSGVIQNVYADVSGRRINAGYSATIVHGDLGPLLIATNISRPYGGYYDRGYGRYGYPSYDRYGGYGNRGYYERYGYPTRGYGNYGYDPYYRNQGRYGGYGYPNYGNRSRSYGGGRNCNRRY